MIHKLEQPALLGGPRTIETETEDEELFRWPIVTDADEQAVLEVLRAGAMSRTEITRAFEREYAAWVGVYAAAYRKVAEQAAQLT